MLAHPLPNLGPSPLIFFPLRYSAILDHFSPPAGPRLSFSEHISLPHVSSLPPLLFSQSTSCSENDCFYDGISNDLYRDPPRSFFDLAPPYPQSPGFPCSPGRHRAILPLQISPSFRVLHLPRETQPSLANSEKEIELKQQSRANYHILEQLNKSPISVL